MFWEEVSDMRKKTSPREQKEKARKIFSLFVSPGCLYDLHFSEAVKDEITALYSNPDRCGSCFDKAMSIVEKPIVQSMVRFLVTDVGKMFKERQLARERENRALEEVKAKSKTIEDLQRKIEEFSQRQDIGEKLKEEMNIMQTTFEIYKATKAKEQEKYLETISQLRAQLDPAKHSMLSSTPHVQPLNATNAKGKVTRSFTTVARTLEPENLSARPNPAIQAQSPGPSSPFNPNERIVSMEKQIKKLEKLVDNYRRKANEATEILRDLLQDVDEDDEEVTEEKKNETPIITTSSSSL